MTPLRARGDAQFWWSQYLWLAALPAAAHVVDALMQLYPRVTTVACVAAGNETLLGTALRVLVPISRLYVGKQVHEPFSAVLRYFGFWGSLVLFKLAFGYLYVVRPMVTPSIALYDEYMNFPEVSFTSTLAQFAAHWSPHFLIFLIDTSIWYALWAALAGAVVGAGDKLGMVRDFAGVRDMFMELPDFFCKHLLAARGDGPPRVPSASKIPTRRESKNNLLAAAARRPRRRRAAAAAAAAAAGSAGSAARREAAAAAAATAPSRRTAEAASLLAKAAAKAGGGGGAAGSAAAARGALGALGETSEQLRGQMADLLRNGTGHALLGAGAAPPELGRDNWYPPLSTPALRGRRG